MKHNLTRKLEFTESEVDRLFKDIFEISTIYEPTGNLKLISHKKDNLVLETAVLGGTNVLVTGDKKDLLPLKEIKGIVIEPPSAFLTRLETMGLI